MTQRFGFIKARVLGGDGQLASIGHGVTSIHYKD